jgi:hypothetical protein
MMKPVRSRAVTWKADKSGRIILKSRMEGGRKWFWTISCDRLAVNGVEPSGYTTTVAKDVVTICVLRTTLFQ